MKHNLKNRPRPGCYKGDPEEPVIKAYFEWFEGFEKELRDSLTWLTTQWHPRKDTEIAKRQAMIDEIKEILGDS